MIRLCSTCRSLFGLLVAAWLTPVVAGAQKNAGNGKDTKAPAPLRAVDTVTVQASKRYGASAVHRLMLGDGWRDLWFTEIDVPVLDLERFAGGLTPTEIGGGAQTKSLRFQAGNGLEYVFRPVYKERLVLDRELRNTIVEDVFSDGLSHSHPTAPVIAREIQEAAGLLHPNPVLVVMPDSPLLGEFRDDFKGKLGTIEEHASMPDDAARGLGGAVDIIDSDDLLEKLNEEPGTRVDARAYLTARLVDVLLGDNDRHRDQWRWARLRDDEAAPWVPIPRDRDKAFVSHDGLLLKVARFVKPILVKYDAKYPSLRALAGKVTENDRRLLGDLERSEWDSVASALRLALTDSVIDAALRAMPREYHAAMPALAAKMKARRDALPVAARRYYALLFGIADVHATDAADQATITRAGDGIIDVELRSGDHTYFQRRFFASETREVRVYLHGGDDRAIVRGSAPRSIPVRVIGGNGTNTMLDSSRIGNKPSAARFYDRGTVHGVSYGEDTAFNRLPWREEAGELVPPGRDYGSRTIPTGAIKSGRGMGIVPKIGFKRYEYRFRHYPHATMLRAEVGYSTEMNGWEIELGGDRRFEASPFHLQFDAEMSQLEVAEFRGYGNNVTGVRDEFFDVRQRAFNLYPSLAYSFGPESDIAIGPVVRSVTTDSLSNRFISQAQPYGFPSFTQAGLRLRLTHDRRDNSDFPRHGYTVEASGTAYPALLDARTPYQEISAVATGYVTLSGIPTRPVVALRAGGKKLSGAFPYFDAAFLGGSRSLRTVPRDRYAGDASAYGSVELRVPLGSFGFMLPWNTGLIGFVDAGRVYVDGQSPGGWHRGAGAGFWLGVLKPSTSITVTFTNNRDRRLLLGTGTSF